MNQTIINLKIKRLIILMLTYETIIKYLMPIENNFSLNSDSTLKGTEFTSFNNLFDDTFHRYGIKTVYNNKNISLKHSILYCILSFYEYHTLLLEDIDKQIPYDDINMIVNELGINIIFFNFDNNIISSSYCGDYFNPWRPTIYLATNGEWYEPIVTQELKLYSYSSTRSVHMKNKILMQNINIHNMNQPICINDNFNEIIEIEGYVNNKSDETFIKNEKPPKSKLDKMKKDELIHLCNTMNKIITLSKPTKKDLIDLILS